MTTTVRHAIVKSIVSGDTLVIKPFSSSGNENEQRISLNYIIAPKLARPPVDIRTLNGATIDEPYAFECREYLRKKLIGQEICYTIDFQIPQNNRLMCTVYLGKDKETGENIGESLLSEGLVELRQQTGRRGNNSQYQRLARIEEQAKLNKRGYYSDELPNNHIRNIKWIIDNPKQFVNEHKSLLLDAIVEYIRNGDTVRCLLLPTYSFVTIQLTGIKCSLNEPFAEEAKQYIETRLLQRQVKVLLDDVNNKNLVGTLLHPNGNIALCLLRDGLAKCVDWSLMLLQQDWGEKYRTAEKFAKDNRSRIWQNYVAKPDLTNTDNNVAVAAATVDGKSNDSSLKGYQAKVLEIIKGDALIIRDLRNNKTRKIYLSSVRAPHATDFQQKSNANNPNANCQQIKRPLYEIPYLFDARELLRKRLIGKNVDVVTDYIRPANNDYPEQIYCTVYVEKVNIAEVLISEGLAKTIRRPQDDNQRSSRYNDLLIAEQQAKKHAVGLFSTGSGLHPIVDMTDNRNKKRAEDLLDILRHNGRMEGLIEFVASGSRFRVHLLKNNWLILFSLAEIYCPRADRHIHLNNNSKEQKIILGETLGKEALAFSKEHFLQRDVFIHVENMDSKGHFIGRLTTTDRQPAVLMLVQAGLAIFDNSTTTAPKLKQLKKKEERQRNERTVLSTNFQKPLLKKNNEEENNPEDGNIDETEIINFDDPNFRRVVLTYITLELKIYVQYSEQGEQLEQLQNELREFFNQKESIDKHTPKKGELLAARFTLDNQWYRARVEKIEENNRIFVYFIDYGNREVITDLTQITTLPSDFSKLPRQAHECQLAYVRSPPDEDDRQYARKTLLDEIGNDECLIKVEYRENYTEFISLYHANTKENLVKNLAEEGLIVINNNQQERSTLLYKQLKQAQAIAKAAHRALWQYSDDIGK